MKKQKNALHQSLSRVAKEIEKLKEEAEKIEQRNTNKFLNLPKGVVFAFGKYEISMH